MRGMVILQTDLRGDQFSRNFCFYNKITLVTMLRMHPNVLSVATITDICRDNKFRLEFR